MDTGFVRKSHPQKTAVSISLVGSIFLASLLIFAPRHAEGSFQEDAFGHGTCLVTTWKSGRASFVADSREVNTVPPQPPQIATACKIIFPNPYVLVSFDGVANWLQCWGPEKWIALEAASGILGHIATRPSEEQLRKAAVDWQDAFENFFQKNGCSPRTEPPDVAIAQLLLVARSVKGNLLRVNAAFTNDSGKLHRHDIDITYPPEDGSTYSRVSGSCSRFNRAQSPLTPPEQSTRNRVFTDIQNKQIDGIADLTFIGLEYEAFASSVSQREASEKGEIADVAGPYDEATLDLNQNRWTLKPSPSGCSAAPPEQSTNHSGKNHTKKITK